MIENKSFSTFFKKEMNDEEMSITAYANKSNELDRSGHLIEDTAWDLKNFLLNPVVPAFHDYKRPPVAKALWAKVIPGQGLRFKIQFAKTAEGLEFYELYRSGVMSAFSVGFRAHKYIEKEDFTAKDIQKYSRNGKIPEVVFQEVELLEVSVVVVPDHFGALVERQASGMIHTKEVNDFIEVVKQSPEYIEIVEKYSQPEEKAKVIGFIDLEGKCDNCEEKRGDVSIEEDVEKTEPDMEDKPEKSCKKEDGECTGEDCEEYGTCEDEAKKSFELEGVKSEDAIEDKGISDDSEAGLLDISDNGAGEADELVKEKEVNLDEIIEDSLKELEDENIETKEYDTRQDFDSVQKTIDLFNSMKIKNLTNEMKEQIKKQYGEEFDISSVKVEPYGFEYKIFCKFLGCKVKEIFTNDFFIPTVERGNYLSAIKTVLKDAILLDQRAFTQNGCEVPLKYSTIKLNSKRSDEFLIAGTQFYKSTDGESFILQFYPVWGGMIADIYCSKDKNKIAKSLFVDSVKWVEKNNFLRGEKFSVSGEFLERKEIEWDDVIYSSDKDKETIKKNVEKLSETSPSRGMMLVGPPGNGKTTLGKVMMNKMDSTFIWASSKDFEYGADYTLGIGFEMARKLAPSVFFIEDIDGWLNAYTVDLLKTEMDGIRDNKGVLTILTSNFPESMPEALIDRPGRFHHIINFSLPNKENRIKLLKFFTENADKEVIEKFADMTEGYSGSHLRELVDYAKMISEDEGISIDEALIKSFEQMKEQRQLIHDIKNEPKKKELIDVRIENKSGIDFEINDIKTEVIDFEIKKQSVDFEITKEEAQEIIKNSILNVSKEMQSIEDLVDERIKRAKGIIF